MSGRLMGWGYQGKTLEDLIDFMRAENAALLIDVRLTPISRVKGFSKTRLRDGLLAAGLSYEHRRELGNPKSNRPGYAHPGTPDALAAHRRYFEEVTDTPEAQEAVDDIVRYLDAGINVVLLCFEDDQACCHRLQIIETVSLRQADIRQLALAS